MAAKSGRLAASAPIFAALGDETRLRLVSRLCAGGPQSITRLTTGSNVTRQAVTKHLHALAAAGLARGARHGREIRWALDAARFDVARRYLELMSEQWTRRLASLERHLDAMVEGDSPTPDGAGHRRAGSGIRARRRSSASRNSGVNPSPRSSAS